ncbi:unnamed protein product [Caenorhabditis auriculariae]|uniref:Potassium channel tetramerisation-type BTB domain-containing protein n=1 Tax=Caenorhabditis auriculariae TaxID=2777116 RepID=A0A8S1HRK6_9PELO|nr:unnamed protein product [Caenorhabditis auriculariae]
MVADWITILDVRGGQKNELYKIYIGDAICDDNSHYFIDRDPTLFHYILNYMRDGRVILPDDGHTAARLRVEAQALNLDELAEGLLPFMSKSTGFIEIKFQ